MLSRLLPLCVVLAIFGCSEASKAPPAAKSGPAAAPAVSSTQNNAAPTTSGAVAARQEASQSKPAADVAESRPAATGGSVPKDDEHDDDTAAETAASDQKPADEGEEKKPPTAEQAMKAATRKAQMGKWKEAVEELEKGLEGDPENVNLLFNLAFFTQNAAKAGRKTDYSMFEKSADYLDRGLKTNPEFADNPQIRSFAGTVLYNAACAQAVDKKPEEALATLKRAVESGYKDLSQMEKDKDLESVRALDGFPEFLTKARETIREQLREEVEKMIAETKSFDFDFDLTDIEGEAIAKGDFKGKVLIVDVWGTWCPPCRAEIPSFVALVDKFKEAGLEIVGLNSERTKDDEKALELVKDFHKENKMNYRCALAKRETIEQIPDMEGFPTTLFFDRTGNVRVKIVGAHPYDTLEAVVQYLLDEKPAEAAGAR